LVKLHAGLRSCLHGKLRSSGAQQPKPGDGSHPKDRKEMKILIHVENCPEGLSREELHGQLRSSLLIA
jgi:hypothetical protein